MTKRMLIDTTHAEETRVVVLDGNRLEDYDVETSAKKQIKGNIYLAKIVRIEPSLQAAFVEYGGNRHGFLAFSEIHPDYYQIPVADRERLIALQEEEARAEEARADHEDGDDDEEPGQDQGRHEHDHGQAEEARSEHEPHGHSKHPDRDDADDDAVIDTTAKSIDPFGATPDGPEDQQPRATASLAIHDETIRADFDAGTSQDAAPEESADDGPTEDAAHAAGEDGGHETRDRAPRRNGRRNEPRDEQSDEPAPETVGGENVGDEDSRAQRRTARFLRQYKIQEVMRRRQILLIQVVKEERGNKGAALTTYISLAGRFCVLMPNSLRGGGVSRKITSAADRRRLKEITTELEIPRGMAMIVRTAGAQRPRPEIRRDCEYLLRTWDDIRENTLASTAPCLVYEEASLIKRAIRDVYTRDIEEIVVDGEPGWKGAREFMRTLMPSNANKVNLWRDSSQPLFSHYQVEHHLDAMLQPTVQLRSGGYLVINQTEALVAIDVNSGRSTRERSVEETALRTNMEAADEVARQLRLRDLAGLIVIDFIDMEARRNNSMVERRLKDALRNDRARIQVGSISHFGLMEMSRQRLRPSLAESSFVTCSHCGGSGFMRGIESSALHVLRAIEEEAGKRKAAEILVRVAGSVAFYVLNHKRAWLQEIESRHQITVHLAADDRLIPPALEIEKVRPYLAPPPVADAVPVQATRIPIQAMPPAASDETDETWDDEPAQAPDVAVARQPGAPSVSAADRAVPASEGEGEQPRKRRRRRRRGGRREDGSVIPEGSAQPELDDGESDDESPGEIAANAVPTLLPGETLASASVFETGRDDDHVAPVEANARQTVEANARQSIEANARQSSRPNFGQPNVGQPGAGQPEAGETEAGQQEMPGRGRRRRGGGRNRPRPGTGEAESPSQDNARPAASAPRPYNGPTPADPFGGGDAFDIFELIERGAEENMALAPDPSASAASHAPARQPAGPRQTQAPAYQQADPATAALTPEPVAPEPVPQETVPQEREAAETGTPEATLALGVVDGPAPAPEPAALTGPAIEATPEAEAGSTPATTAKPRKPRASRARKTVAVEAGETATPVPLLEPVASSAVDPDVSVADALPPEPERTEAATVPEPAPEPAVAASAPSAGTAVDAPAAPAGPDPSIVRPIIIGSEASPAARRTGWWKR
ncbi:Rne/Rng family ribonuclease [Lichenicola sp.]|uniref:Rne/Rng family ribonuclease n=1 Tax=Lichenicola sp. TaxID=2804529 RepID=UPI003B009249